MEKKNLKWYEAPAMELVDVKLQGMICTSPFTPGDGGGSEDVTDVDPGFGL